MRRRGFTFVEAMVSLGLIGLLLGVVGSLMSTYATMVRRSGIQAPTLYNAEAALDAMAPDLRAAITVAAPTGSTNSTNVTLTRVDPWVPNRLPHPIPSPLPTAVWLPHPSGQLDQITYYVGNTSLLCQTIYFDGSQETDDVCDGICGLAAQRLDNQCVELTASVQDYSTGTLQVLTLTTEVVLHIPPAVVP